VEFVAQSEGVSLEPAAAALIARAAQGGWRDALSLLEQVVSYAPERVTVSDVSAVLGAVDDESLAELTNRIIEQDPVGAVSALDGLLAAGKDVRQLLQNLADFLRDCLMESLSPGTETSRPLVKMDARTGVNLLELTARAERELRWNTQHRLVMELMLFRMTTPVAAPVAVSRMPAERQSEGDEEPSRSTRPQGAARTAPLRPTALSSRAATAPASGGPVEQTGAIDKPVAPPAVPAGTVISRDVVEQNWKTLLARVGARSRRLQALLREAVPTECDGQALTLQFRYEYHFLGIDEITARREVETVLAEVLGQPLRIVCKLDEAPTQRPRPRPATPDGPLTDEDLRGIFPGWEVGEQ
jgi:DNA polymerase-3 subunit gamma/tau